MNDPGYIAISFNDEKPLVKAVKKLLENNVVIADVRTPFPVHGIDNLLRIKRSRIPVGGFIFGVIGAVSAFGFMTWVFTSSYPLIIGGKPFFAAPSFIPITFEMTVLFGGISMVVALLVRSKLKPDIFFKPIDERITDDLFVILIETQKTKITQENIRSLLSGIDFMEIKQE